MPGIMTSEMTACGLNAVAMMVAAVPPHALRARWPLASTMKACVSAINSLVVHDEDAQPIGFGIMERGVAGF